MGVLVETATGQTRPGLVLEGTKFLPSLSNTVWSLQPPEGKSAIGVKQQLQIKRARIRVEILKQESDVHAKYELFQRLNTGGVGLSEQEVHNCVAVMIDEDFYHWLKRLAETEDFQKAIDQTEYSLQQQNHVELALRFFASITDNR